jgi:hypothetical protein
LFLQGSPVGNLTLGIFQGLRMTEVIRKAAAAAFFVKRCLAEDWVKWLENAVHASISSAPRLTAGWSRAAIADDYGLCAARGGRPQACCASRSSIPQSL